MHNKNALNSKKKKVNYTSRQCKTVHSPTKENLAIKNGR